MESKINLLKLKHTKRRLWLGLGAIVLALINLYLESTENDGSFIFDSTISIYFILLGVFHLYESRGVSASQLIGKSYLHLTKTKMAYKPKYYKAENVISLEKLSYIEDRLNRLILAEQSGAKTVIELSNYTYEIVRQIRESIAAIAAENQLEVRQATRKNGK